MNIHPAAGDQRRTARRFVAVAVGVISAEAAAYILFALWGLGDIAAGGVPSALGVAAFLAGFGLAQLYACWKLWQWQSWARGPLVFTQLIVVGLSWGLRDSSEPWIAAVLLTCAVTSLVCLLATPVTRALMDGEGM